MTVISNAVWCIKFVSENPIEFACMNLQGKANGLIDVERVGNEWLEMDS